MPAQVLSLDPLNSENAGTQGPGEVPSTCGTRKHSPSEWRRPVTCSNRTDECRGGALVDQRAVANPQAQQARGLRKYREVELSGLEPLTSCMPCGIRQSALV